MSESNSNLKNKLIAHRDLLANLSSRNRELYYKETAGSSINISKFPFAKSAIVEGKEVAFSPGKFMDDAFVQVFSGERELNLQEHFFVDLIKDSAAVKKLYNKIDKIRLSDDRHQREFGISGAWLLGPFLCWRMSGQSKREELVISPIFKIPIDLKKNKKKQLVLKAEDGDVFFNPSLLLALKQLFGLKVAEDQKFENAKVALEHFRTAMGECGKKLTFASTDESAIPRYPQKFKIEKNEDGEIVDRIAIPLEEALTEQELKIYDSVTIQDFLIIDTVYLDQLNASRMVLIKDYDEIIDAGINHDILNELFSGVAHGEEIPVDRSKLKELDSYRERDNYFVVDIDSTQHRAIDSARKSKAIVIQGPPGSGKSQTIVNLIADYLAKGKKVLFVSEKRPALDVVYNRMKGANIESQAVLIHSSDLNKSDLYKSFLEMAAAAPCEVSQREWHDLTESLDHTKKEMNAYAAALSAENQKSGLSHSDLIVATSLVDQNLIIPDVYSKFSHLNYDRIKRFSRDFGLIQDLLSKCSDLQNSPWMYRKPDVVKTNILEFKLRDLKNSFDSSIDKVKSLNAIMSETAGDVSNDIHEEIGKLQDHGALPLQYEALWNKSKHDLRNALSTLILSLKAALARLEKHKSSYYSIVPDADPEVVKELEVYYSKSRGIIDWFSGVYWRQRDLRKNICHDWNGTNRQFTGYREYRESFDELHLLADSFNSQVTLDVDKHTGTRAWVEQQIGRLQNLELFLSNADLKLTVKMKNAALGSLDGFNDTVGGISKIKAALQDIKAVKEESNRRWAELNDYITNVPSCGDDSVRSEFVGKMIDSLPDLEVVDKADLEIRRIEDLFEIQDLKGTINKFFSKVKVRWTDVLESTMLNTWTEQVITSDPTLRSFSRDRVVSLVDSFRNSSEMHKKGSQEAVHQSFAMRWTSSSDRSGIPLLRREAEKQRKVLSPREIMEKGALATMMQLKPCWLMSPLSISQILPLQKGLFDVIIFDEASQVRVEDAIPSIYRASTMIVVGDNKQMPPTNFFSGGVIDDDEDDFEIEPSVLDLASMVYPSVLLEWHYRSKSESLIAFSNRAFYGGKLIAAPNPQMMTAGGALKFNLVQNGYFTTKSGNETEAEVLVDDLFERIRLNPDRSYGVIAMGQKQANAIDEAIEKKIDRDPEARRLYERALAFKDGESDAGLFVKNLENVQGDERDVIILSVGYAPAAPGKKLRMNFGPLSKKGGGRRLNVAATRAKSEMHVYCSFDPGSIPVDEESFSKNPDLCVFGRYLTYSKAVSDQNLELAMDILNSFPIAGTITNRKSSRFALDVKRRLEENGHKVSAEIGSSGFFIDLGIHHPVIQSNFALGIECDGAIFHSTPYARDRDKIREALLKSRGWKIERIWSQDWSRDWRSEVIRIERALLMADKALSGEESVGEDIRMTKVEE